MAYRERQSKYASSARTYKAEDPNKREKLGWPLKVAMIGVLPGAFLSLYLKGYMLMTFGVFFGIMLGIAALGALLQWKWFVKKGWMHGRSATGPVGYAFYNLFGVGFVGMAIFCALNMAITIGESKTVEYQIEGVDPQYIASANMLVVLQLQENAFDDDPDYRGLPYKVFLYWSKGYRTIGFETQTGIFGIPVKKSKFIRFDEKWARENDLSPEEIANGIANPTYSMDQWLRW